MKEKDEGYNKPRMQEQEQQKEETREHKGGKEQLPAGRKRDGASSSSSRISPAWHRKSLQGSDAWLSSRLYPRHLGQSLVRRMCQKDMW